MRNEFMWNPVFKFVMAVKDAYKAKYSDIEYKMYKDDSTGFMKEITCFEYWIKKLNNPDVSTRIGALQITQYGSMILLRYGRYGNVSVGEIEATDNDFWDLFDGFYKECRSLVIDLENESIVLAPFKKFRNLNECPENDISAIQNKIKTAKNIEITNKIDGSMQSARLYGDKIIMSGSQALNSAQSWRLEDGYNRINSQSNYVQMISDNPDFTFVFEYVTLADAHVVNYTNEQQGMYLIGMRNVYTGEQLSYHTIKEYADVYHVWMAEIYDKTLDDVMNDLSVYKSSEKEGFVMNIDGHMIKIKCDDYVQIHRILSNISSVNLIIKNIADDTFDDLISKVPDIYKWRIDKIANLVFDYITTMKKEVEGLYYLYWNPNKVYGTHNICETEEAKRKNFMIWIDTSVPKTHKTYVRNMYFGIENNYIKGGNEKCPKYKKLKEMNITDEYSALFVMEE